MKHNISYLESLSDEVLLQVLSTISTQDLTSLACTSTRIKDLCNDEPLWKLRYRQAGGTRPTTRDSTWKKMCLQLPINLELASLQNRHNKIYRQLNHQATTLVIAGNTKAEKVKNLRAALILIELVLPLEQTQRRAYFNSVRGDYSNDVINFTLLTLYPRKEVKYWETRADYYWMDFGNKISNNDYKSLNS